MLPIKPSACSSHVLLVVFCLCFHKQPLHSGAGCTAEISFVLKPSALWSVLFRRKAGLWKSITQFEGKTALVQKVCAGELLPDLSSHPHHPSSSPSLRTVSTGAVFRPVIFAHLVNTSCYQRCGLSWLSTEMAQWVVFGSAWRAPRQWALREQQGHVPLGTATQVRQRWWCWDVQMAPDVEALRDRDSFCCSLRFFPPWPLMNRLLDHEQTHQQQRSAEESSSQSVQKMKYLCSC